MEGVVEGLMFRFLGFYGALGIFLVLVMMAISLQNLQPTQFYAGFKEFQLPGIHLILGVFGLGILTGLCFASRLQRAESEQKEAHRPRLQEGSSDGEKES